ncbi:hypothetical protein NIES4071_00960 [Calothrix sp. NIES-4071]|nr:hypothetical protein NIES4071_00960 [Calothrix sp. NIES-4071]BAZ54442.1 hypothetical protein NIES4105_00950 [Calothrix sp. NIES-4105]
MTNDLAKIASATNEQHTVTQIFSDHLKLITKDILAWLELFAEDAIIEFPYASTIGLTNRLEGKLAIYDHMKDVPANMQNLIFTNIRSHQTLNPNVLFAEVHGEATITATGRRYQQDYVMQLETKDGKIIHYREYWNPIPALEAWGSIENLNQSFNAE